MSERIRERGREGETFFCEWSSSSFFWRARALASSELGEAKISLVPIFFFFSFLLLLEAESEINMLTHALTHGHALIHATR